MTSQKYKVRSTDDMAEEFKKKAVAFSRTLRGLEDRAAKCESLKWMDKQSSSTVMSKAESDSTLLDWQPYLNDGKRKLTRTSEKLKEIQKHRKQKKISFIFSVKEALPSWAKKKVRGSHIQLNQFVNDTDDYQALIDDIILQINPADELSKLVYKICQMQDSNQNDELTKGLHNLSSRWNSLNLKVINNSNSLESLGLDVDHEYRKLNEWYQKCDALRPWLDSTENISNAEVGNEITVNEVKEKLPTVQEKIKECQSQKPQLQQINGDADVLLDSGRLDQGDAERVERINETLSTRFSTISAKLEEAQSKLYSRIHALKNMPDQKKETQIVEVTVEPNLMPPRKVISPFHKDEDKTNKHKITDSMKSIKKLAQPGTASKTVSEKERIQQESSTEFNASLETCEKALDELDEESLLNFSAVGSTVMEVQEQLDDIQVLEENMKQENNNFILVKETFEESESMNVMTVESRVKLRRKVDDLKDRWQEMWRSHEVNKQRLVQAILIMGGEWMRRVRNSLDELEESMNAVEIKEDELNALREEEKRHKNIINKIASHEDSVSAAVDVAREVHRRDLVTEETGETIQRETKALEDRLEGLIGDAEKRKQRIAEALRNAEQTTTVNETMVASSVIAVHSSPDESHDDSQSDEGFVEPKHHFFKKKPTYESLINQKIKDFRKETKAMHDWMDESETLVKSFSVDMDSQKATKVQQKVNTHYEEIKEKQAKLDHIVLLSKQIENETLDPTVSEPFVKQADHLKERWKKVKEMIENYGEADAGSKAKEGNCCVIFLKKRLFPAWYYN